MRSPPRLPGSAPNEILAGTEVATGLLLGVLALRACAQELAQRRQVPIPHLLDPGDPRRHIPKRIDRQSIVFVPTSGRSIAVRVGPGLSRLLETIKATRPDLPIEVARRKAPLGYS